MRSATKWLLAALLSGSACSSSPAAIATPPAAPTEGETQVAPEVKEADEWCSRCERRPANPARGRSP